ncbi:filamin-B isoform X2 [Aplysia californica]|uniref:Filamin-B isoform X2 n=1 Tax=Aplysia californica TaxID=6500 RepID=A0ABM1A6P1_APLCA|nr:filamin-B isoform X2 [Aplysia californica]
MTSITMPANTPEDQWIAIQHKTFVNWANEQLSLGKTEGNRSVENLGTDFCDGVNLVALVEALQFKKIGKVYSRPTSQIQMLQNVTLALHAVEEDHVKLVNIGTDDIVGGNLKLTLGLLWHLILRYQISSSKTKAPPKKLMMLWFQSVLRENNITNFTSSWSDGIALHALCEYCKPGLAPKWRAISPKDRVQNCKNAMQLAKDHLGVPRVISAEDFASSELDELSAMTYLSYFIRKNSPGYFCMLNWACKQLKTTNISNLSTDWNNGFYLCALVHSLGGEVPSWPQIDTSDNVKTCQLGIDSAKGLGIEPILTASELADPGVDHLAIMAYLSKFQAIKPRKPKSERLELMCTVSSVTTGEMVNFDVKATESDFEQSKVQMTVENPGADSPKCTVQWTTKTFGSCNFVPKAAGEYKVHILYDGEAVQGSPLTFSVQPDFSQFRLLGYPSPCKLDQPYKIEVPCPVEMQSSVVVKTKGPSGNENTLTLNPVDSSLKSSFIPNTIGVWSVTLYIEQHEVSIQYLDAFDPSKARLLDPPERCIVGKEVSLEAEIGGCGLDNVEAEVEYSAGRKLGDVQVTGIGLTRTITFTPTVAGPHRVKTTLGGEPIRGTPKTIEVSDPGQVAVTGDGLRQGTRAVEASFNVDKKDLQGDIDVSVENSPFEAHVTDKSLVTLLTDVQELKDENDHIALDYGKLFVLDLDVSQAGPGIFKGEVLSPKGKLIVSVKQTKEQVSMSFTPRTEGDHYIHMYWSNVPIELSPLLGYCPGPPLPVDSSQVVVTGQGAESARATVRAEFIIDGRKAGPGVPKVTMQGVQTELPVEVKPLKYNRYHCSYLSEFPGSFLLYISWSDKMLQRCPIKVNIFAKGDAKKVTVSGEGLNGGIAGHELKVFVDTTAAGPGEITASCQSQHQTARCDVKENNDGHYTLRVLPMEPERHILQVEYDGVHVPGSPFVLRVGEPPDPSKVKVFGPGVENGLIDWFESRFLVETQGAGAGQLAVKVRGPRGGFKVDMRRETKSERTITCRYDPSEPGEYSISVRWSGVHVPGSPFSVNLVETKEELHVIMMRQGKVIADEDDEWRAEI